MTKEESLQILDNCLKQLEAMPEDEVFDFFYNNSLSFKKEINRLRKKEKQNEDSGCGRRRQRACYHLQAA